MTGSTAEHGATEGRWWFLAGTFLVTAGLLLAVGLRGHSVALDAPRLAGHAIEPPQPVFVSRSRPITLVIPAIGVNTSLVTLGKNADGSVEVPNSWNLAGWYRLGPAPGQLGSAVILGHVDSYQGPAVFYELRELRPHDRILVTLADGRKLHFIVRGIAMYSKSNFPTSLVYGSRPYSALQLVTCGGEFDSATHHYLSNVVVYTELSLSHHTTSPS